MSAQDLFALADRLEQASGPDQALSDDVLLATGIGSFGQNITDSFDAALKLLPEGADWRKLTHPSISVYAANPYNANAQKRIDGNGATPALQMCVAAIRLKAEIVAKFEVASARSTSRTAGEA